MRYVRREPCCNTTSAAGIVISLSSSYSFVMITWQIISSKPELMLYFIGSEYCSPGDQNDEGCGWWDISPGDWSPRSCSSYFRQRYSNDSVILSGVQSIAEDMSQHIWLQCKIRSWQANHWHQVFVMSLFVTVSVTVLSHWWGSKWWLIDFWRSTVDQWKRDWKELDKHFGSPVCRTIADVNNNKVKDELCEISNRGRPVKGDDSWFYCSTFNQ